MMVAYLVEALLVTLFCAALGFSRLRRGRSRVERLLLSDRRAQTLLDAFRGCVISLWSATAVLNLAVLAISLRMTDRLNSQGDRKHIVEMLSLPISAYDGELATIASAFTTFPVFLLTLLSAGGRRRRWLRAGVAFVAYVLLFAQLRLATKRQKYFWTAGNQLSPAQQFCGVDRPARMFSRFLALAFYIVLLTPICLSVAAAASFVIHRLRLGATGYEQAEAEFNMRVELVGHDNESLGPSPPPPRPPKPAPRLPG